ncbi:hypothetical protein FEM48_Zijuj11G0078100 [Ziziphus jujuba var. spinosa]|uniref:Pectinesterase inhibitor domain-containing protein n=1 Tax=Ziziphus jujuba var. spinosa TaxID=714518 RepID=A0A978UHQ6_ZIZJJ|nr:hypothetical protein FEM48_Zijuj11G0078100 [Ziziphus jujuba var. spinosa]
MWHISFFSVLYFCLLLIISHQTAVSADIINQTCKKCADESIVFSYEFCSASLQEVPESNVTNLQGLGSIAIKLALDNATNTISIIEQLLTNKTLDPFALACLEDCSEHYSEAITTLKDSIKIFLEKDYDTARRLLTVVMTAVTTCEDCFKDKEGVVSPLENENYSLFQLSDIALCIVHLLSLVVRSYN